MAHKNCSVSEHMTRDELKPCSAYTVEVICAGKTELAELHDAASHRPFLLLGKKITPKNDPISWTHPQPYYLTDEDIAGLRRNGAHNLFSRITLTSPTQHSTLSSRPTIKSPT